MLQYFVSQIFFFPQMILIQQRMAELRNLLIVASQKLTNEMDSTEADSHKSPRPTTEPRLLVKQEH